MMPPKRNIKRYRRDVRVDPVQPSSTSHGEDEAKKDQWRIGPKSGASRMAYRGRSDVLSQSTRRQGEDEVASEVSEKLMTISESKPLPTLTKPLKNMYMRWVFIWSVFNPILT